MGRGTNLFQAFGNVPPGVATAPSSAEMRNRVRDTCQPPRFPAAALRQLWHENRCPAAATTSATSASVSAGMPDSAAANSNVNSAYSPERISSNASNVTGTCGWQAVRYSAQFHQRRTNSRSYALAWIRWLAIARLIAASLPGWGDSQ